MHAPALFLCLAAAASRPAATAFQFPFELPSLPFRSPADPASELLSAVSGTGNGKSASPAVQRAVLDRVSRLEASFAPRRSAALAADLSRLDGTWYLQYTSPSSVGDPGAFPDEWKVGNSPEPGTVLTNDREEFRAQGTIRAAGITVTPSETVARQIFDVAGGRVTNEVDQRFGRVRVGGAFRPSEEVVNRAVVEFDKAEIELRGGPTVRFGFVFGLLRLLNKEREANWLEITYLDDRLRLSRGNKGSMFVLTRDPDAVTP